jgi:hypothetical protein
MEAKKTKAEVEKLMDKRVFDDEDEPSSPDEADDINQSSLAVEIDSDSGPESQASGDDASYSMEPESSVGAAASTAASTLQQSVVPSPIGSHPNSKKRINSREPSLDRKKKKDDWIVFCVSYDLFVIL